MLMKIQRGRRRGHLQGVLVVHMVNVANLLNRHNGRPEGGPYDDACHSFHFS